MFSVDTVFERPNVLLTLSGRKAYVSRTLRGSSKMGRIIAADADPFSTIREFSDEFEIVPPVSRRAEYLAELLTISLRHKINAILCQNDLDIKILSECAHRFHEHGVRVLTAPFEIVSIVTDKFVLKDWLGERGFLYPKTFSPRDAAHKLAFPAIAKARFGQGSQDLKVLNSSAEAANLDDGSLVQEMIDGPEYNLDILRDSGGNVIAVVPKKKLAMWFGSTDKATSIYDDALINLGIQIGHCVGHVGSIDVDVIRGCHGWYVIDINPRIGGGFPYTALFCPKYVDALVEICAGEKPKQIIGEYRSGVTVYRDTYYFEVNNAGSGFPPEIAQT